MIQELTALVSSSDLYSDSSIVSSLFTVIIFIFQVFGSLLNKPEMSISNEYIFEMILQNGI